MQLRRFIFPLALSLFCIACQPGVAAQVSFSQPPTANRVEGGYEFRFAISQPADVEIAIVDAKGHVVRHLAAGVLGGKAAPPPPLAAGLEQTLVWDGLDDDAKAARGEPFQLRVRAGMTPKFGRMIGGSPYTGSVVQMPYRAPVNGLAVDSQGNLIVKMMSSVGSHGNSGMWPWHVRRFDRQGEYVATILPYPPSTGREQASGVELLETDSAFTPANQNSLYPVFSIMGNELAPRMVSDELLFVRSETRELNFLRLDGSNRLRTIKMWPDEAKLNCPRWLDIQVAISPDGRYAYYSNVAAAAYDGKTPSDIDPLWPQGRIYRHDLTRDGAVPEKFFDIALPDFEKQPYWMPSAWDKKTAAAGIDCDAKGNVLVCDLVGGQVIEIDAGGKQQSATAVEWPDKVLVSRHGGVMYVISREVSRGNLPPATVRKIKGRGTAAKIVAELPLEGTIGGAYTLDESGDLPVLWLAGSTDAGDKLLRVEDRGENLAVTGDQFLNRDAHAITFVGYADVDPEAELVYVTRSGGTVWRFDGKTGEGGPLEIKAVDLAVGPGGYVYTWGNTGGYDGPIARYTRELEPAPLDSTGEHTYGEVYGRAGRGNSVCGMDVDRLGRVFATYGTNECHVRAYDATGKLVDFPRKHKVETRRGHEEVPVAISGVIGYGGSIRVDREGNLYLLQAGLPEDHMPPKGWEEDEAYRVAVGTIHKFPPTGGEVRTADWAVKEVSGSVASYPGCGPVSRWRADGACACTKPRFDVDGFGRLYIPNGITFSVAVCDNAGNEIARFGSYGNFDCQGPNSREPKPDIPLGWPVTAGATDGHIYVGDCLNHRVVRVDKTFGAETVVDIPAR
jgi:hypothetical protein